MVKIVTDHSIANEIISIYVNNKASMSELQKAIAREITTHDKLIIMPQELANSNSLERACVVAVRWHHSEYLIFDILSNYGCRTNVSFEEATDFIYSVLFLSDDSEKMSQHFEYTLK